GIGRQTFSDRYPGAAEIGSAVNVRPEVIELMVIDYGIGRTDRKTRRLDHTHEAPIRHSFRGDVYPAFTGISCDLDPSIVRSHPDQSRFKRGLRDCGDHVEVFDCRVVLGDRATGRILLRSIVSRQIRADDIPGLAFIPSLE